ncbi:hypothetical protein DFH09DRAFT_1118905 [Mycena vulgaris]|nr:hypothetical protein DFH09DRAFT_1118905 [Mycena vulgaris]
MKFNSAGKIPHESCVGHIEFNLDKTGLRYAPALMMSDSEFITQIFDSCCVCCKYTAKQMRVISLNNKITLAAIPDCAVGDIGRELDANSQPCLPTPSSAAARSCLHVRERPLRVSPVRSPAIGAPYELWGIEGEWGRLAVELIGAISTRLILVWIRKRHHLSQGPSASERAGWDGYSRTSLYRFCIHLARSVEMKHGEVRFHSHYSLTFPGAWWATLLRSWRGFGRNARGCGSGLGYAATEPRRWCSRGKDERLAVLALELGGACEDASPGTLLFNGCSLGPLARTNGADTGGADIRLRIMTRPLWAADTYAQRSGGAVRRARTCPLGAPSYQGGGDALDWSASSSASMLRAARVLSGGGWTVGDAGGAVRECVACLQHLMGHYVGDGERIQVMVEDEYGGVQRMRATEVASYYDFHWARIAATGNLYLHYPQFIIVIAFLATQTLVPFFNALRKIAQVSDGSWMSSIGGRIYHLWVIYGNNV